MKRTLTRSKTTRGIFLNLVTQNGVRTRSKPFYLKDYRDYVPRSDGYNVELAEAMWEQIHLVPSLWEQGVWRRVITSDAELEGLAKIQRENGVLDGHTDDIALTIQQDLEGMLVQHLKDESAPACGTAMCAAGLVTELSGVDFLVDFEMAHWAHKQGVVLDGLGEYVLVPKSLIEEHNKDYRDLDGLEYVSPMRIDSRVINTFPYQSPYGTKMLQMLAKRGFTDDTHALVSIMTWATWQLGLRYTDGEVPMFSANNSLFDIRRHLDNYAVNGPSAHDPEDLGEHDIEVPYREKSELGTPLDEWLATVGLTQHG